MTGSKDHQIRLNFQSVRILLLEQSPHGLEILSQIFFGFGARDCLKATTVEEAQRIVREKKIDLMFVDINLKGSDGLEFVRWLRRSEIEVNQATPVVVVSANGSNQTVIAARNAGASFFLVKPLTPESVLGRVMYVMKDNRDFIVAKTYAGPDRRVRFEGVPAGIDPRRSTDLTTELGDAKEPNLTQSDLDSFFKPQKVSL